MLSNILVLFYIVMMIGWYVQTIKEYYRLFPLATHVPALVLTIYGIMSILWPITFIVGFFWQIFRGK